MATASAQARRAKIGSKIRALRTRAGLRPVQLARALDLTQPSVRNWETGKTSPSIGLLPDLARVLNADLDELYALYGIKRAA